MYHSLQARISFGVRNKGLTPKGDFNPPETSEEGVFQRRRGPKIWPLACHGFSLDVSVLVGKHRAVQSASVLRVRFGGKVFTLFTTGKHQLNLKLQGFCFMAKTSFQFIVR